MPFPQKFTQGEWYATGLHEIGCKLPGRKEPPFHKCIATVHWDGSDETETAANARLMAKAPAMFALLDKIASEIERDEIPVENRGETYVEICELLNEIAGGDKRADYLRDVSVRVTCHLPEKRD